MKKTILAVILISASLNASASTCDVEEFVVTIDRDIKTESTISSTYEFNVGCDSAYVKDNRKSVPYISSVSNVRADTKGVDEQSSRPTVKSHAAISRVGDMLLFKRIDSSTFELTFSNSKVAEWKQFETPETIMSLPVIDKDELTIKMSLKGPGIVSSRNSTGDMQITVERNI